jgi:poly(3-hydroxybutyrate) depolymerase
MPIGEFDGAATLSATDAPVFVSPIYWLYEMGHAALDPSRAIAQATQLYFINPANPLAQTAYG